MPLNIIETFSINHLKILDEKGRVDPDLEPVLSRGELLKLHRAMTLSRMVDSRMLNLQRQGRLGTLPLCRGQEASFCASILAIRDRDWFVGSYREFRWTGTIPWPYIRGSRKRWIGPEMMGGQPS